MSCTQQKDCMTKITLMSMVEEMDSFWGVQDEHDHETLFTTTSRSKSVYQKLISSFYRDVVTNSSKTKKSNIHQGKYSFSVGLNHNVKVCEQAYLNIIGHPYSSMWKRAKLKIEDEICSGNSKPDMELIDKMIKSSKYKSETKSRKKFEHAEQFILWFANTNGSASPNEGEEDLLILPFETISQLFSEYQSHCSNDHQLSYGYAAKRETFRRAWAELHKKKMCRFTRGKGTFPTCDICNNANDMLANARGSKYTQKQREIIISYKVIFEK